MSTITSLLGTDLITNSRTDINDNFANLNNDKIETSVIDTDTTLAANSDAKLPSQKAVKAYVDAGGNVNASTVAKGIVEEATSTEVITATGTGTTGARLFVSPTIVAETGNDKIVKTKSTGLLDASIMPASAVSFIATPPFPIFTEATVQRNINTSMLLCKFIVPFRIVVNKIYFGVTAAAVNGTFLLGVFSEDGQTRHISVTSDTVNGAITFKADVSAVTLPAGIYYIGILPNGTADATFRGFSLGNTMTLPSSGLPINGLNQPLNTSPVYLGTLSTTASTMPSTITPTSVAHATGGIFFRLDN